MVEPVTMTVAATEVVATMSECTEAAGAVAGTGSDVAGASAVGGTSEAFVSTLDIDPSSIGNMVLGRAETTGAEISKTFGSAGQEIMPRLEEKPAGDAAAISRSSQFDPKQWIEWRPADGEIVSPKTVAERFQTLREGNNLDAYVKNTGERDVGFGKELDRRLQQFRDAHTPADRDAALQQVKKSTTGKLGESIANDGFKPLFQNFEVQRRVETANGTTIVDGRLTGARNNIILGRGHGVSEGGNLSFEVKTGQPSYLESQVSHIADRQVQGHVNLGDQSLVIVSRDVYAMNGERAARDTISEAGSYVMALLPDKRLMDEAIVRVLRERMGLPA